ncbi:MAG: ParB/RepB/Spo0J family partition protein [Anaerolineae bacterium]|nr:ParB/RepB/Spo0J family partition protein [Anaerolineae bacterium]
MKVLLSQVVVRKEDLPDEWLGANEFTESIKERGVQQPIQVVRLLAAPKSKPTKNHQPRYLLIHGRHRWWSAKHARKKEIDVEVIKLDPNNRRQHLEFALVSNEVQTDIDPVTRGKRYQQLIDEGATVEEIAELTKKSISFIYQHVDLLKLIPPIQEGVQWRRVLFSQARELLRLEENAQREAWNELLARCKSRNGEIRDLPLNEVRNVVRAFKALDAAQSKQDEYKQNGKTNGNGPKQDNTSQKDGAWSNLYQNYLNANSLAAQQTEEQIGGDTKDPISTLEEIAEHLMALADESDERKGESQTRRLARNLYAVLARIEPVLRQLKGRTVEKNGHTRRKQ